jgi:hypothetical protein
MFIGPGIQHLATGGYLQITRQHSITKNEIEVAVGANCDSNDVWMVHLT